ncbi:hypothetical protein MVEG_00132 [Podila verticillata NRRL 6337]|nr:hypothetical protein MVEG_00132 [Podila verticillata NRRL 6337]
MLSSRSAIIPPDSLANGYDSRLPAQEFKIFDTHKTYQDTIKIETQKDPFGDLVVYWTDIMHLHENAIYLKDNNGKVTTFVKNDSQEMRMPLRVLYSRDPLTIIVHKAPPDHVIVPLSKGLRIEPERTLSASTRIRKNLYRAFIGTKSTPEALMDSIGAHYYHQTTTIMPEKNRDSQLTKIPESLNEIMPPPPPPYAPLPPASQMISTAPMTAQRASGNAQLYPPFPLSSTMMATSVEDPTSLPPLLPARVQPLLPGANAGPAILAPSKMELDADSQEQHQPQQQQQKQQRVILGQISSGNELVGMQTSHKKPGVATTSKDGHSRPTIIEKYIWAMEKSSELTVPAAGMVGDNHDRSHGRDRASPTSSLSSTSAAVGNNFNNTSLPNISVPPCKRSGANVFNILILGETQAGKSTFVQAVKQYANPSHIIEKDTIGGGNTSKTKVVHRSCVNTRYPVHEVRLEASSLSGVEPTAVNVDAILDENKSDWEDYESELDDRKKKKLHRLNDPKEQEMHHIHLFDTPGLDDTNGEDEIHIASIIKSLKTAGSIHLVLVIVGGSAFTPGFQSSLECYMDVFPEFQGIIAFVHTKFDYVNFHPLRKDKLAGMDERMKKLHEIMGRTSCKHFVIDCNFETTKPIRRCITQNTIREILMKAKSNLPVSISTETVRKTPKMKAIDRIIINKYNAILTARIETLKTKDVEQSAVLDRIIQLDTKLNMILATESEMSDYIKIHDTTDYIFIDELDFNEPWRLVDLDRRHTVSFPSQVYPIHRVTIVQEHIYIKRTRGGEGEKFWEIDFKRKAYKKGVLHAKFYTTFAERFKANIMDAQEKLTAAQRDHPGAIQELKEFTENNARLLQEIDVLRQMNKQATDMIAKASEPSVNLAQFEASVARGVYSGDHAEVVELIDMRYRVAISDIW